MLACSGDFPKNHEVDREAGEITARRVASPSGVIVWSSRIFVKLISGKVAKAEERAFPATMLILKAKFTKLAPFFRISFLSPVSLLVSQIVSVEFVNLEPLHKALISLK